MNNARSGASKLTTSSPSFYLIPLWQLVRLCPLLYRLLPQGQPPGTSHWPSPPKSHPSSPPFCFSASSTHSPVQRKTSTLQGRNPGPSHASSLTVQFFLEDTSPLLDGASWTTVKDQAYDSSDPQNTRLANALNAPETMSSEGTGLGS